jgi:hypothetical protein
VFVLHPRPGDVFTSGLVLTTAVTIFERANCQTDARHTCLDITAGFDSISRCTTTVARYKIATIATIHPLTAPGFSSVFQITVWYATVITVSRFFYSGSNFLAFHYG